MGKIKDRARRISSSRAGRVAGGGLLRVGTVATCAAIGAGSQDAGQFAADKFAFVREKWWGEAAALGAAAVLAQKRGRREIACALAGAAGYSFRQRMKFQANIDGRSQVSPVPLFARTGTPQQLPAAGTAQGIHEAAGLHAGVF